MGGDKDWAVPDAAKNTKNPVKNTTENLKKGMDLFTKHCKSCHGAGGKGDGPKAVDLNTPCSDFTEKTFQAQTDGSLFYKIREGREDMPTFKTKISTEEEVWCIVNYLRTLSATVSKTETAQPKTSDEKKDKSGAKSDKEKNTTSGKEAVASKPDSASAQERSAIELMLKRYEKAINSSDTLAVCSIFTSDGMVMPSQSATASGKDQLKTYFTGLFKTVRFATMFSFEMIEQTDNMAFVRASSKEENMLLTGKQKYSEEKREIFFLKKINGEWKISNYIDNKASGIVK